MSTNDKKTGLGREQAARKLTIRALTEAETKDVVGSQHAKVVIPDPPAGPNPYPGPPTPTPPPKPPKQEN